MIKQGRSTLNLAYRHPHQAPSPAQALLSLTPRKVARHRVKGPTSTPVRKQIRDAHNDGLAIYRLDVVPIAPFVVLPLRIHLQCSPRTAKARAMLD